MARSRSGTVLEDDIESSIGRSSEEELGEMDAFLDQKQPWSSSVREVRNFDSEECPLCLRIGWRTALSFWRLKDKHAATPCTHTKIDVQEYLRKTSTTPKARLRRRRCRLLTTFILVVFATFGVWNAITLMIGLGPLIWDPSIAVDHFFPNWGQPGQPGEADGYPTDLTRDIAPMPCHSHNDYWRRVPLYEAIHYGCVGVEADVWLFDEELYVGHITASLTKNRTLKSLYVDPLVQILDKMNEVPQLGAAVTPPQIRGVFEQAPEQTLVLLIDFKMDGHEQFPVVSEHLQALRSRNYLTYFDGQKVIPGAVTIIATGNAPFDSVTANTTYRDIFFDAPLDKLSDEPTTLAAQEVSAADSLLPVTVTGPASTAGQGNTGVDPSLGSSQFSSANSYYASVNFKRTIGSPYRGRLTHKQLKLLRQQIKAAHEKGLKARYWDTPTWPVGLRNHIWKVLVEEGADILNVDDLRSAKMVDWERSWRHRFVGGL